MTKPTLKERLEKMFLGRVVRTQHGDIGTVEAVSVDVYAAYPIIVRVGEDMEHYAPHQLVVLKPKQKKPEVNYVKLAEWWNAQPADALKFPSGGNASFKSLCELLGVRKP